MNNKTTILLTMVLASSLSADCAKAIQFGAPTSTDSSSYRADQTLCKADTFVLGYSYDAKQPVWSATYLTRPSVKKVDANAAKEFKADEEIPREHRATLSDYHGSGFEKYLLTPYTSIDSNSDPKPAQDAFLLSNVSPSGVGLGANGWGDVDALAISATKELGAIYVINGPMFIDNTITIGKGKVKVPSHFYKIAYSPSKRRMWAYVVQNKRVAQGGANDRATTVDWIEAQTGLDFFPNLSKHLQDKLESEMEVVVPSKNRGHGVTTRGYGFGIGRRGFYY